MKRIIFLCVFLQTFSLMTFANSRHINLNQLGQLPGHSQQPIPTDLPEVYYDDDAQEVIIYGNGTATYYNVDIISLTTMNVVLSDMVDGYCGCIDVSALPNDNYLIVITSSNNNTYEGYLTISKKSRIPWFFR